MSLQLRSESRRLIGDPIERGHFYPLSSEAADGLGARRIASFRVAPAAKGSLSKGTVSIEEVRTTFFVTLRFP